MTALIWRRRKFLILDCSIPTVFCVAINIGIVPSPNTNIRAAPVAMSLPAIAIMSAPYTNPHGKNPQSRPANKALPKLSIGNTFLRSGASDCQKRIPNFSNSLNSGNPSMASPINTNTAPSTILGALLLIMD